MRYTKLVFFLMAGIVLISCNNKPVEVVKSSFVDGKPEKVEYLDKDSQLVKSVEYYKNGQKKIEGAFKNEQREGEWMYWYENGKLWSRGSFKNGKSEGRFLSYNEDGTLFQEAMYTNGIPDGKWCFYKEEKRVKEVYYEMGKIINEIDL